MKYYYDNCNITSSLRTEIETLKTKVTELKSNVHSQASEFKTPNAIVNEEEIIQNIVNRQQRCQVI